MTSLTGTCECGTKVTRPAAPEGRWAARIDELAFVCAVCNDRTERENEARDDAEQAEEARRTHAHRVNASSIPAGRRHLTLDDLDVTADRAPAIADSRLWAVDQLPGVGLLGPNGTGKTQIAASAAIARLASAREVVWYSASELVDHLSRGFASHERARAQAAIDSTAPLVLDDFDKCRPSEYAAEQLLRAIDSCDAQGRQLIVTSNLRFGELPAIWPARYGDAVASRLAGHCKVHVVGGRDRRVNP